MMRKVLLILCSSALISAGVIGSDYAPASPISYSATPIFKKTFNTPIGYTKIIQSPPVYQTKLTTKEKNYESPDGTQHTAYTKSLDTAYSSLTKYESKSTKDGDVIANTIPGYYSTAAPSPIVYHQEAAYTVSSPLVHTVHTPVLTKSVSVPVAYTTHNVPITKTIVSPSFPSYSTPVSDQTKYVASDSSAYFSHAPVHTPVLTKSLSVPVSYATHNVPLTKTIVSPSFTTYSTPVFDQTKYEASGLSAYSSHTPVIESQPIKTTITYSQAPLVSHMSFSGLGASYAW